MQMSLFGTYIISGITKRALRIIHKGLNINRNMTGCLFTVEVIVSAVGGHYVQLAETVTGKTPKVLFVGSAWRFLSSSFIF